MADGQNPAQTDPATPPAGDPGTPSTTPPTDEQASKWDGPFDETRAAKLVENLRAEVAALKAKATTPPPAPKDEPKDEAAERIAALEAKYAAAERRAIVATVSTETGVPADLLVGDDETSMKAHAAKLAEWAKSLTPGEGIPGKPRPALVPGHGGEEPAPFDPSAVARAARHR